MFCSKCGAQNNESSLFCNACGASLKNESHEIKNDVEIVEFEPRFVDDKNQTRIVIWNILLVISVLWFLYICYAFSEIDKLSKFQGVANGLYGSMPQLNNLIASKAIENAHSSLMNQAFFDICLFILSIIKGPIVTKFSNASVAFKYSQNLSAESIIKLLTDSGFSEISKDGNEYKFIFKKLNYKEELIAKINIPNKTVQATTKANNPTPNVKKTLAKLKDAFNS